MITMTATGNFNNTEKFLKKMSQGEIFRSLSRYGAEGVRALALATPLDTGRTALSWSYEVVLGKGTYSIIWNNSHVINGRPIAILLQYGHGTRNGGWVVGRDYINPALRPIFDRIVEEAWKEVTTA